MKVFPYDIEFIQDNDQANNGRFFGLILTEYPIIPASKRGYTSYAIPGRDGELLQDDKTKENITIAVPLTLVINEDSQLQYSDVVRQIQRWLTGSGWLRFNDNAPFWYRVLSCQFNESTRLTPISGTVSANFIIEPYEYINSGRLFYPANELKFNGYDTCMPIYKITGEKAGTLTINGYTITINVGQNLVIDTKAQLTYRLSDNEIINTAITGDYDKMHLKNGAVNIVASNGLTVEVMPMWGYEL